MVTFSEVNISRVYKIYYLIVLKNKKKKKKTSSFIGILINKKENKIIELTNKINKEQIIMKFTKNSPAIIKIVHLKVYNTLNFRSSRLYFIKKISYFDDIKAKGNGLTLGFISYKKNYFYSAFFKKKFPRKRKKLKRLKRRYFRTLNWKKLKLKVKLEFRKIYKKRY